MDQDISADAATPDAVDVEPVEPEQVAAPRQAPRTKPRPTETLPTDRIAFQKQLKLLIAYAAIYEQTGNPVSNEEAGEVVGLSAGTTSLANAFFADVRFLVRADGGYIPSAEVQSFRRLTDIDPEHAAGELEPLLSRAWFAQALLPKLAMGYLSQEAALVEIHKRANASIDYRPQVRTLLDYLVASSVVDLDGEQVRRSRGSRSQAPEPEFAPSPPPSTGEHPFIVGLLQALPAVGTTWSDAKRQDWVDAAQAVFNMIYERPPEDSVVQLKITPSGKED